MPAHRANKWPDARVARLRELLCYGRSAGHLAKKLNDEFNTALTRSAVIGKLHRIGLRTFGASSAAHHPHRHRARPAKIKEIPKMAQPSLGQCGLLELTAQRCHWPIGEPVAGMLYCGEPVAIGCYCEGHHRVGIDRRKATTARLAWRIGHGRR